MIELKKIQRVAATGKSACLSASLPGAEHEVARADNRLTCLARLNFRDDRRMFGIRRADRRAHMYVIGKTGTGKSTLLEGLINQDIAAGEGLALLAG